MMKDESRKPAGYAQHRENQRERILEAAERVFTASGIDGASLSDIARAARLTRNTVYEYFPNKQEVAWAVLGRIFERAHAGLEYETGWNGFQRLEHFMLERIREVETHPARLRFIVEFNALYAREASAEHMRQVTGQARGGEEDPVFRWVRLGIQDGSLRPDLDAALVSAAARNLLSGMSARFALLGDLVADEYGQPVMLIYREICAAFLRGIRSNP
jgi:AcrR family transcriptional regulator